MREVLSDCDLGINTVYLNCSVDYLLGRTDDPLGGIDPQ